MTSRKGVSYLEVILALTIAAVFFTAVLPLIFNSITKNRDTKLRLIAYEEASNQIEQLRQEKISSLVAPTDTTFTIPAIPGATGHIILKKLLGDQKIASVRVTVDWTFNKRSAHEEINTYLYGSTE
jgi:type II secretory pathway pseudopilin PulG